MLGFSIKIFKKKLIVVLLYANTNRVVIDKYNAEIRNPKSGYRLQTATYFA